MLFLACFFAMTHHCGKPLDNAGSRPYSMRMDTTTTTPNIVPQLVCETIAKLQDRDMSEVRELRALAIERGNRTRSQRMIRVIDIYITACDVVLSGGRV